MTLNSKFADIEAIQVAQIATAGIEADPEDSHSSDLSIFMSDCIGAG